MIKNIFRAIGGRFTKQAPSSTGNKPIEVVADEIYKTSAVCADAVCGNGGVGEDCRLAITMTFMHAFIHAADRAAVLRIPEKRQAVMDELVLTCSAYLINAFAGPGINAEQKQTLVGNVVEKYNEASRAYGACKKSFPVGQESPQGTFVWEFGKRYAAAAKHNMDVMHIAVGSKLFTDSLISLKLSEKLNML